jgi:ribose transport system ATP-binding protein
VTAVVLDKTSLYEDRGSYIRTLLGAALIQQILNATVFLSLSQAWQYWFLGLMTLVAAGVYSQARRVREGT